MALRSIDVKRPSQLGLIWITLASAFTVTRAAEPPRASVITSIDLSRAFGTRSAWHFVASRKPPSPDFVVAAADEAPEAVTMCVRADRADSCDPALRNTLRDTANGDPFLEPRYLNTAEIVYPRGHAGKPLLLLQTASMHSGDGDQLVLTQVLAYAKEFDRFSRVYDHSVGSNNNQEVRYIIAGAMEGDIVSVEPTENASFGFWVSVHTLTPAYTYKQVLRFRSATKYADGNPLKVIDSEMPNIHQRLGLWRPGFTLPLPSTACAKPHLIRMELWCG